MCLLLPEEQMKPEAAGQVRILSAMGISNADDIGSPDLVVDAIFGYGLSRAPTGRAELLIEQTNEGVSQVLSLDVPSGLMRRRAPRLG